MPQNSPLEITYDNPIESAVSQIASLLGAEYPISKRAVSLLLLQEDQDTRRSVSQKEGDRSQQIDAIVESTKRKYRRPLSYVIRMRLQEEAARILSSVITVPAERRTPLGERLSRLTISPVTGLPILAAVLYLGLYQFVGVLGAGTLVDFVEGSLFQRYINPFITDLVARSVPYQTIRDLIVGQYGLVTLGLTYAVAIILPIVGTFFLVFSVIEDSGYLPRLALLLDRMFKTIGLTGRAVIPIVLGLGCDTMATMVTRTQETKRERVIATLLLALAIPCSAQLGVIFAVLSGHPRALAVWVIVIASSFLLTGFLASRILPGARPSFYMELPPLRLPKISNVVVKTYSRMVWYFKEILPLFLLVSVLVWLFQLVGVFDAIMGALEPVVRLIGLPDKTASIFLFGFFRRDYGAAGLFDMRSALTATQTTVAAVTLTLFVPCIAQFMMMIKERGTRTALAILAFIICFAFGVGFLLNLFLTSFRVQL